MTEHSAIERIVMRRVRLIRILGLVISTGAFAGFTFVAALWGIGKEVWVARVFENAPERILDAPQFYLAAFAHTHLAVQALALATLASLFFLIREMYRLLFDVHASSAPAKAYSDTR